MKLYLTLEGETGIKIERVCLINEETPYNIGGIVEDMINSYAIIKDAENEINETK